MEHSFKGAVVAVIAKSESVEIWVSSPTGDASDSHVFTMRCRTQDQADLIAGQWRAIWGVPDYSKLTNA